MPFWSVLRLLLLFLACLAALCVGYNLVEWSRRLSLSECFIISILSIVGIYCQSLYGHSSGIDSVTFDASEVLVAAGAASGTIKLWDLEEAKSKFSCS